MQNIDWLKLQSFARKGSEFGTKALRLLAASLLLFICMPLMTFSQSLLVLSLSGDGYYTPSNGAEWQPAVEGASLGAGTTIVTGFNSTVELQLGTTRLVLGPGSRVLFESSRTVDGVPQISLVLLAGSVSVDQAEGSPERLSIGGPVGVLSSNRSKYVFGNGRIDVELGEVTVVTTRGQNVTVGAGQGADIAGQPGGVSVAQQLKASSTVNPGSGPGSGSNASTTTPSLTGTVNLSVSIYVYEGN